MTLSFDDVYGWLNFFDSDPRLEPSVARMVQNMKDAWQNHDIPALTRYVNWLQQIKSSLSDMEARAEVFLECGWIYYQMGDYSRAVIEFQSAAGLYRSSHPHNAAIAWWLLGCTDWRLAHASRGLKHWSDGCRAFERLIQDNRNSSWYQDRVKEMQETLDAAIDAGRWPLSP